MVLRRHSGLLVVLGSMDTVDLAEEEEKVCNVGSTNRAYGKEEVAEEVSGAQ